MRLWSRKLKNVIRFLFDGQDGHILLLQGIASVVSAALLARLNIKSQLSLRIEPDTESHVPARATASGHSSQNTVGSKDKRTQLKN